MPDPADPPQPTSPARVGSPPAATTLSTLGSDAWAVLLGAARRALTARHEAGGAGRSGGEDEEIETLRTAPTSRLVAGSLRAQLTRRLADDVSLWHDTVAALPAATELPTELAALLDPARAGDAAGTSTPPATGATPTTAAPGVDGRAGPSEGDATGSAPAGELERARRRAREAYQERDRYRRSAEGAAARVQRLEDANAELERALATARDELDRSQELLDQAAEAQQRAVERERRRRDAEIERLEATIAELRRIEEERRVEEKRRREAAEASQDEAARARRDAQRRERDDGAPRAVPGRPSQLPPGVEHGTTAAASALLQRGRLVLIDGYNVTKQHREHLDLDAQRSWLVQLVGVLTSQRGIRPVVVFDGQAAGGGQGPAVHRDVRVQFTMAGVTADDELVLAVEATDEPVVVVTDDRELIQRVRRSGADVVGTRSLLGLVA